MDDKAEFKFIDAYIKYNNLSIEQYESDDGIIEFYPAFINTVVINTIIINNIKDVDKILSEFFYKLIKELCIIKIIIIKKNILLHKYLINSIINYRFNNIIFYNHFECLILSINRYLCGRLCCY
jgi:hypothetical protein